MRCASEHEWCSRSGVALHPWALAVAAIVAAVALGPPIASPAHDELVWHMVQHLILSMVVAPALLIGLGRWGSDRLGRLGFLAHPALGWIVFVGVMWGVHLSPLYDAALDFEPLHIAEHGLFLGAGLMFWAPVVGFGPRKLAWHVRMGYLIAALPAQSFLGLLIYSGDDPLYTHYPSLDDQRAGALVMWLGGDALMLAALGVCAVFWLKHLSAEESAG